MHKIHPIVRKFLIVGSIALLASCSSGGGSSDDDEGFPTPTLPSGARTLDAGNAVDTAEESIAFLDAINTISALKSAEPLSPTQIAKLVIERGIKPRIRSAATANKTENLSDDLCVEGGTAILTFEETSNSEDGDLDLTGCKVDVDIEINGKLLYESSWNDNTLDYDLQIGGTLQFAIFGENVTLVLNLIQSGNEGTGEFGGEVSFSIDGIPGGGYLVTTSEPWAGDVGGIQSGRLLIRGGNDTRVRITVTATDVADVELNTGSGWVFQDTIFI